jgi:signal transduction histidine kinase
MRYVRRFREIVSTLRFQIVLWCTAVVFVIVIIKNVAVREVEDYLVRHSYDEFLLASLEDVDLLIARTEKVGATHLADALNNKVQSNDYRSWFLQLFDANGRLVWGSSNAPTLQPPVFAKESNGPYDFAKHRVFERKLKKDSGEWYYLRCGFQQIVLQDDIALINRILLLASFSILIFAPIGAYFIALRATRPIAQIIATASHLQPSNLNERLPIRGTGDELDQLSTTINGMLDRLASFIDQNRDFVANAAHELRSPLTAIRSSVEVALNRGRTPEEYAAVLTDVMEEVSRLAGLVNRLLILAEADAGRLTGTDQRTRLDKIVLESADMFEAVAEANGVHLVVGEVAEAVVAGDETCLRQVVRNLLDNAIKYNRPDGEVLVRLQIDDLQKLATLTVKDSGIGIDPNVLPRVFERFYRADKARTREKERLGYGLGLSICQTIVRALRGEIAIETTSDEGTTFVVQLPLLLNPPAGTPAPAHIAASAG